MSQCKWRLAAVVLLLGGAASPVTAQEALSLSMKEAVGLAIEPDGATRIQLAREAVEQARSRRDQARAALLPQVDSYVQYDDRTTNLKAFGIDFQIPGAPFEFPEKAGPFNVFDARAQAGQTIFNYSAIRRFQAARTGVKAAGAQHDSARTLVASQVAKAYLAALRAEARLEAAEANVALAEELLDLAENQKAAGTGTGIDITRASVQLSNERQALLVAKNARRRAHFELLRAMDLKLSVHLDLSDRLVYHPLDIQAAETALETALASRPDWQARRLQEESARRNHSSVKWERLPTVAAFGNYGVIGNGVEGSFPTRTYGVRLSVPVFDGGRMDARRAETSSAYRQERIQTADLREQIELEVRLALDALSSAREQVEVSRDGLALAENELAQAQRRFRAGVTSSIEVTDAQNRLARARDNQIAALFNYESARLDLGQAMGTILDMVR